MGKYYGKVGFAVSEEYPEGSGIWIDHVVERFYYGDTQRYTNAKWTSGESINDNLQINNQISILADPFATQHFSQIKFVEFMGAAWKVTNAEAMRPRILLTLGGEWNGERESVE